LGVENGLHWVLDIAFQEDASRMRKDHSQHNFVVLRHMALNLLKQERTAKCGIKARRLKAGWSEDYLRQVLAA
jgi:predicted transposase YbfD/YdcC